MRTALRVLLGLVLASLTAALVKVLHVITPAELLNLSGSALVDRLGRAADLVALTATHEAFFVLPLSLIAAIVCEVNRIRNAFAYVVIGVIIAAAGFYVQMTGESVTRTIVNAYAGQAYALQGMAAGFIYWLSAGRFAGWRRGGGLVKAQPYPIGKPRLRVSDVSDSDPQTVEKS
jgi:hypothetical protein